MVFWKDKKPCEFISTKLRCRFSRENEDVLPCTTNLLRYDHMAQMVASLQLPVAEIQHCTLRAFLSYKTWSRSTPSPASTLPHAFRTHTHTGCGGADAQQWDGSWLLKSSGERGGVAGSRQRCINPHFQIWRKKRSLSEARPPHWPFKTPRGSAPRSSPWIQERLGTQLRLSNAEVG